jgi:hypothetical protein
MFSQCVQDKQESLSKVYTAIYVVLGAFSKKKFKMRFAPVSVNGARKQLY